jgi:hypothetical protein
MAESATVAKPKRPVAEIQRDLEKARAKHKELHPQVERDTKKGNAHNERIAAKMAEWKKLHPDEPFDEDDAGFDATPYAFNAAIQAEFHAIHYKIAQLEDELAVATKDRASA